VAAVLWCLVLGWIAFVRSSSVPLLALVDLGFHELGHLLTYPLPWDGVTAAMGTVFQIGVPLGLAAYFGLVRRDHVGPAVCLAWAGTAARDASVYIADAPFERLQLIGGDHDWAFLLHGSDHLDWAAPLATAVRFGGLLLLLAGLGLAAAAALRRERPAPAGAVPIRWAAVHHEVPSGPSGPEV
jgi:hypothetical protein